MRAALLCLFLSLGLSLVAQNAAQDNPNSQPQNEPNTTETPSEPVQFKVPTLPQQGHPLDPHDVEVLTGKSSTSTPASERAGYAGYAGYYAYGANVPLFTGGQFNSTRSFGDQRFFRNFGAFNPRGFLFFGSRGFGTFGAGGSPGRFSTQPSTGTATVVSGR
jgi:hypothetical protein